MIQPLITLLIGVVYVYSMLAPEDRPATHARVMKVVNSSTPTPTANAAQSVDSKVAKYTDDYASNSEGETSGTTGTVEAEVDDGWNVVPARSKGGSLSLSPPLCSQSSIGSLGTPGD